MEIKIKLKLKEGVEIELTENESKDLYNLLSRIHANPQASPIIIEKWIKEIPWYNPPYWTSERDSSIPIITYSINT